MCQYSTNFSTSDGEYIGVWNINLQVADSFAKMHLWGFELKFSAANLTIDSFVPLAQMWSLQNNLEENYKCKHFNLCNVAELNS